MGHIGRTVRPLPRGQAAPFWRDARVLRVLLQVLFLLVVALAAGLLYANMMKGLERLGLQIHFGFLGHEAGFGISEGIAYSFGDTYARAMWVGAVNTLRVSITGVVLASVLGLFIGLARLSGNWLVRKMSTVYVETIRNTPLLLQLMFWYNAVILRLPPVRQSYSLREAVFMNVRGVYLPRPLASDGFATWRWMLIASVAVGVALYLIRWYRARRTDRPGFPLVWAVGGFLLCALASWFLVPQPPLTLELPRLMGFNFQGGIRLSPEFAALVLGLTMYTSAFIAEVVRGGVQSVHKGQREAAMAIGLKGWQVSYLVVVPQALRTIIPPLTSQYLNLFKNSSLAIAVGFPDLFSVGNTTLNQTGQSIPVFLMIMAAYLSMSLVTSALMNWYNHRVRLIER